MTQQLYTPAQIHQFAHFLSCGDNPLAVLHDAARHVFHATVTIREERMSPGMCKYHIGDLPFDAVLHHFTAPDTGFAHDHPWSFTTHILQGSYVEEIYSLITPVPIMQHRKQGTVHYVTDKTIHRLSALPEVECWTLCLPEYNPSGTTHFYRYENGWQKRRWGEENWREAR